jgi:Domain of unknown function (DUF4082)
MYTRALYGLRAIVIVVGLVSLLFGTVAVGVGPVRTWVPLMGLATTAKSSDAVNPAAIKAGAKNPRVTDFVENKLAANVSSPAIAAVEPTCPCSAWPSATIPANASVADPNAVELGVKFRIDVAGFITGVRFYKGSANIGTHVGNLWTSAGQLLASATFVNETASGWQQVNFATPVAIAANTIYVCRRQFLLYRRRRRQWCRPFASGWGEWRQWRLRLRAKQRFPKFNFSGEQLLGGCSLYDGFGSRYDTAHGGSDIACQWRDWCQRDDGGHGNIQRSHECDHYQYEHH